MYIRYIRSYLKLIHKNTIIVCADRAAVIKYLGPIYHPTYQPVVPKVLPLTTVMVHHSREKIFCVGSPPFIMLVTY